MLSVLFWLGLGLSLGLVDVALASSTYDLVNIPASDPANSFPCSAYVLAVIGAQHLDDDDDALP